MPIKLYTCIIFFSTGEAPHKYRNVNNLERFKRFVIANKNYATYFNVYDKETKKFVERITIETRI